MVVFLESMTFRIKRVESCGKPHGRDEIRLVLRDLRLYSVASLLLLAKRFRAAELRRHSPAGMAGKPT